MINTPLKDNNYEEYRNCLLCSKKFRTYKRMSRKYCNLTHSYIHRTVKSYLITKKEILKLNKTTLSWLSGFWEGEGYLTLRHGYRNYNLSISQNEKNVINYIKQIIPSGKVLTYKVKNTIMTCFTLHGIGAALAFVEGIYPYIHTNKRKKTIEKFLKIVKHKGFKKYV